MLNRLSCITDLTRARPLLQVLLKLFRLCVKVKKNQEVLTRPELNAIWVFLNVLIDLNAEENNASKSSIAELLDVSSRNIKMGRNNMKFMYYQFLTIFR